MGARNREQFETLQDPLEDRYRAACAGDVATLIRLTEPFCVVGQTLEKSPALTFGSA